MSKHHFVACDGCNQEIKNDDPPYYSRPRLERDTSVPYRLLQRRDLCETCYRRLNQAILQLPNFEWLLDGFEIVKK